MVNITGLSKAKVLKALYDNSHMQGMSFLAAPSRPITLKDCEEALKHNTYFDYFYGRVIKVDLSGNKFDERLYDRDNGNGAAAKAVNSIRK